ncbi:MAG: hypothetical protein ABR912_02105 [Terracidiphilus sp.]|jgi:hypothetical protein
MTRISINRVFIVGAFLAIAWPLHSAFAQREETGIDMSIQLSNGHVRTPPFKVKRHPYWVDLWVKTNLSYDEWCCAIRADRMMNNTSNSIPGCNRETSHRIQASWTLWDGAQLVAQGPSQKDTSGCEPGAIGIRDFYLGSFQGKRGKMYVLDLDLKNVDPNLEFTDVRLKVWPTPEM